MNQGIFITATGTDVGKTYVSALLLKKLRKLGNAGYFKAALSGAERRNGALIPGDAAYVCSVAGLDEAPENLVAYMFEPAVSPHLAARMEGVTIEKDVLCAHAASLKGRYDFLVAEGCGGLVCPLCMETPVLMLSDVARMLGFPLLIVTDAGLGSINATVLTVAYAEKEGLPVRGIILNRYDTASFLHQDNRRQIERLTGLPVISCVENGADEISIDPSCLWSVTKK